MVSLSDPCRILITGCSGGGKSTLLDDLAQQGFAVVPEPGRRIVAEERAAEGRALPWVDELAFAKRALEMARADFFAANAGTTVFDRGLVDAAVALATLTGAPLQETLSGLRYDDPVFLAPPWPEIFAQDADRRHGLAAAMAEYARICDGLSALDYRVIALPKISVAARAAFVVDRLSGAKIL